MKNPMLPALAVQFSGTSDFVNAAGLQTRARFTISYPQTAPEIDLGKFLTAPVSGFPSTVFFNVSLNRILKMATTRNAAVTIM